MHLMFLFTAMFYKHLLKNHLVLLLERGIGTKGKFKVPQKHKM